MINLRCGAMGRLGLLGGGLVVERDAAVVFVAAVLSQRGIRLALPPDEVGDGYD